MRSTEKCCSCQTYFKKDRTLRNIIIRTLSGGVYIGLIIGSILWHKVAFAGVCLLLNLAGLYEFGQFGKKTKVNTLVLLLSGLFIFVLSHLVFMGIVGFNKIILLLLIPLLFLMANLYSTKEFTLNETARLIFGLMYISIPFVLLNYLNITEGDNNAPLVLMVFILIWVNDTFAFLSGLTFGRHKIFERITPKKTWEGFLGGITATVIAAWFMHRFVDLTRLNWIILSAIIAITAVYGDFVESLFKRNANVKDSGNLIPGHGGILDRIDSLLFVFPVVFIYLKLLS